MEFPKINCWGFLLCTLLSIGMYSCSNEVPEEYFEGVLYSDVTYSSKIDTITAQEIFGKEYAKEVLYVKSGFFKLNTSPSAVSMMLWRHTDPKIYFFKDQKDTLWHMPASQNNSPDFKHFFIHGADTILGHICDALVIDYGATVLTYYYSPEFNLNPELYSDLTYNSKNKVMQLLKSPTLRLKIESAFGVIDSRVTKIEQKKLTDNVFDIPEHKVLLEHEN